MSKDFLCGVELNHIYQMDCLEGMKLIPDKSVDMILCDPPYGSTRNRWDTVIPLNEMWEQYERIIKDSGAIVLTAQTPFDKVLGASNIKLLKYEWIWEKTNATGHLNAKKMPMKAHENILVFYKKLPTYNPQKTTGHVRKVSKLEHQTSSKLSSNYNEFTLKGYDSTERYPRSVQVFSMDKQKRAFHPTQKPEALFKYLINTYTNPGDIVLDNCIGSGTTAVAALKTNRSFIGFETDENSFRYANERIESTYNELESEKTMEGLS